MTGNALIYKSCIVASAARKAFVWKRSCNLGIDSSVNSFLFWKLLTFLWFFQHDSGPSAPIRISGLTCFHTLLPFDCSLPTGSALPAWRQIEGKKGMKGALLMLLLPAESSGWNARRSHAGTLGRIVGCGVMWVGAHDFLSSSHLQCSKLLCRKLLLAASLPSAAPPQGRCAPWCTGETSLHRAGLPPLHSLPSFALWFSPLPCNPLSCFKNVKGSVPVLDSRSLGYYYLPFCSFKTKCLVFCRAEREREAGGIIHSFDIKKQNKSTMTCSCSSLTHNPPNVSAKKYVLI